MLEAPFPEPEKKSRPMRTHALPLLAAALLPATGLAEKELFVPEKVYKVPDDNDYDDPESDYSRERMTEGDNVAIFWHREYGEDPMSNPDETKRFDVARMLAECERVYECYVEDLELVEKGDSVSDDYKLLIYVYGGEGGTAFGGGQDDRIGALWTPAVRVNREPYGVLAHELGHSFQYMSRVDSGTGPGGPVNEMSAQYFLWQVYPDWMTFENYHLVDFMKKTHFAFLHPTNMYHSPYVLEYWSGKHGRDHYGDLSRETRRGEDVVATYKRMHGLDQEAFNDEMYDACRRFITWDMERIEEVARPHANQHQCKLEARGDGWLRIAPERCPQNYGYNGIGLKVPAAGTELAVGFRGIAGADGFSGVKTDRAGWRYGLLAHLADNRRVYGEVQRDVEGEATLEVPEGTEHLWLVVMGAPTEHWPVAGGRNGGESTPEEQWPYEIRVDGTELLEGFLESEPRSEGPGTASREAP